MPRSKIFDTFYEEYIVIAILHYIAAIFAVGGAVSVGGNMHYIYEAGGYLSSDTSGYGGAALGLGVVAASLIVCGSFFLYKHFERLNK